MTTTASKPVLEGVAISKSYTGKGRRMQALSSVDFRLEKGEILGIVGESGSGKSTLLRVISGIEKPDSGRLYHDGAEYTGASCAQTGRFMQMVFQDAVRSFDPRMPLRHSLSETGARSEEEIFAMIEKVGLQPELLTRRPGRLSGGQCQRMSIARALLAQVKILLCDEITSALDVTTQAQVIRLLKELRETEELSVIFVSHDLALVSSLCDRIMVIQRGVCVEEGTTAQVIGTPRHSYTKELLASVMEA